jgi:putative DNA-invertase from lambdoid prophage Rac
MPPSLFGEAGFFLLRKKILALAQARNIDAILVTELSRWARSTIDLVETLQAVQA